MATNEDNAASTGPRDQIEDARLIEGDDGDDGDEGDFGDEGDLGDEGDEGDLGDEGDGGGDNAEFAERIEMIEEAEVLEFVEDALITEVITESISEIVFELVLTLVFLLTEVDGPSWITDPSRRDTLVSELRPLIEEFTSRGVAPSATELGVLRDRIRARWRG